MTMLCFVFFYSLFKKVNAAVSLKQCFASNQSWWDKTQCFAVEHWTMLRFKHLFGRAGYYFFMFKTIISLLWSGPPPPAPQPGSGQSLFPSASASASALLLHNHAGIFYFFFLFSRPSLWHLLAKISRLLPWNPRHGNASLGIAAAVRTDGLHQGFCVSALLLFFSLSLSVLFLASSCSVCAGADEFGSEMNPDRLGQ